MDFSSFDRLVDERASRWTEELVEFCRIPSETAHPEPLRPAAHWMAERLRELGARTETVTIDGVPPLVLGEIGAGARTVICVQHYDVVPAVPLEPTAEQLAHLRTVPFEEEALKHLHGAAEFVGGQTGFDAQVASMFEPTCNISGIHAGWGGPDMKTVIPAEAHAKLDMRLVPNQDPQRILAHLRRHLDAHGFTDVELRKTLASESPWWTPVSHPLAEAAARASEELFGMPALRIISSMSTAPMYQVCSPHRLPAVGIGLAHPDNRAHAPDENVSLKLMTKATKVFGRFLARFAELPA